MTPTALTMLLPAQAMTRGVVVAVKDERVLAWVSPDTIRICGVRSEVEAEVISDESGWRDAGIEVRRSE
jgi:hypothetical protein